MGIFSTPLPFPRHSHYARLGVGPEATAEEIRTASARYVDGLARSGASDDQIAAINALNLTNEDARAAYDASQPPLALLRLEPTWPALFEDPATALAVLRREVEAYLAARGSPVQSASDLTRTDFSADFVYTPLLDGLDDPTGRTRT